MKKISIIIALCAFISLAYFAMPADEVHAFHTQVELKQFKVNGLNLDSTNNGHFWASGKCEGCHGFDPDGIASVDAAGNDINVIDDWRSSMMANSAKDPFWRAKVSHEVMVNPMHQQALEDKCTSCHAPLGHFAAKIDGATHYSIADMLADSTGLDGVSCAACHVQSPQGLGTLFSGNLIFDTTDKIYGPYEKNIFGAPMQLTLLKDPSFGEHIGDAGLCAGCHTLITETVDLAGDFTGGEFVEQATYHEWLNSDFGRNNVSCQSCHMPRINDPVVISDNYANLVDFPKSPFGQHTLVGGNTFMLELLKNNIEELGLTASTEDFEETLINTMTLLTEHTLDIELEAVEVTSTDISFDLKLINKTGHKFPSGYPSRRAFIQFILFDEQNDTLFKSGTLRSDFEVNGQHPEKEDHYDLITDETQVQIYELVMGDVNGSETTTLERADEPLKDNRLTPKGFLTTDPTYDTVKYAGLVMNDDDFNLDETGAEGSGWDIIRYTVALNGYEGPVSMSAKVYYQSLPPKWMEEMFSYNSAPIDSFREMYFEQDNTPVLIQSLSMDTTSDLSIGINDQDIAEITLFPNPSNGSFQIETEESELSSVTILDLTGRIVANYDDVQNGQTFNLPDAKALYLVRIETTTGESTVLQVIKD